MKIQMNNNSSKPGDQFMSLREAMNQLFDESFLAPTMARGRSRNNSRFPQVDISETDEAIEVRANVPGVDPDEIEIEVDENSVVISGEVEKKSEEEGEKFYRAERSYGKFHRSFRLPVEISPEDVSANANDGVINITLPKKDKKDEKKKIKIKK